MSWPTWPGASVPQSGIVPNPINPAPNVNPVASLMPNSQYTPEQWAQMQQQNWQQWAQWQQQFQQWQQQYGAEYQKSISALTHNAPAPTQPALPLFNMTSAPPPLPTETKPPLPPDDEPQVVPPPSQPVSFTNAPPPTVSLPNIQPNQPPPPRDTYLNPLNVNVNKPPPLLRPNDSFRNEPPQQQNRNFSNNRGPRNQTWQNQTFDNNRHNQQQPSNENFGMKRPYNQPADNSDYKRSKTDYNSDNNKWQPSVQPQKLTEPIARQLESPQWNVKPPVDNAPKTNPEELSEAEKKFDKQFAEWESQFQKWKEQNANHPDKEQYKEYEKKWETWRTQLLDRREQMKRKRLGLIGASPQPGSDKVVVKPENPPPLIPSGVRNVQATAQFVQNAPTKPGLLGVAPNIPNINRPRPAVSEIPSLMSEPIAPPQHLDESLEGGFLKTTSAEGIPGLDLVKHGDEEEEYVEEDKPEQNLDNSKKQDLEAISRGINNILGDQKLMNMLSMVTQTRTSISNSSVTVQSKDPLEEANLEGSSYDTFSNQGNYDSLENKAPNEVVSNIDEQTRSSFNFPCDVDNLENDNYVKDNFYNQKPDMMNKPPDGFNRDFNNPKNDFRNWNQNSDNFNPRPNFDQFNRGNFNKPPENFNKPPDNFNKPHDNFNRPQFNNSNFNQDFRNSSDGGSGNFNRNFGGFQENMNDDDSFNNYDDRGNNYDDRGNNYDDRGNNFGRNNNFNRNCDDFDSNNSNNFNRGRGNFKQQGFNDNVNYDNNQRNYNRNDSFNKEEFGRDMKFNNRGQGGFQQNYDDGPQRFDETPEDESRHSRDSGNYNRDNRFLGKEENSARSNDLPAEESNENNCPWTPEHVIDYDHKSQKPAEPEICIELMFSFDYRHKPLNRIPYPQRPTWLTNIIKNCPQFNLPVMRPKWYNNDRFGSRPVNDYDNRRNDRNNVNDRNRKPPFGYEEHERKFVDRDNKESFEQYNRRPYEDNRDFMRGTKGKSKEREFESVKIESKPKSFKFSPPPEFSRDQKEEKPINKQMNKSQDMKNIPTSSKDNKTNVTSIEDILNPPARYTRPPRLVIILRGPSGSGKSFLSKLIKDKEVENGGSAPRILCLDDYFMVEQEKEVEVEGRKEKVKEMVYEYEQCMEASYRQSLMKSFKKTITDGYFNFIIVDNVNDKVKYFAEMWSFAKQNGFQVYVSELEIDIQLCAKRNTHGRTELDIQRCVLGWEKTPSHHPVLDCTSLIQSGSILEVDMEEINSPASEIMNDEEREFPQEHLSTSKWDTFDYSIDKLAKLDGTNKPLRPSRTMEDYLQLDDEWVQPVCIKPGQKRVRWADLEERKQQEKMRAIGFVVGQTNWDRMMDPTMGSGALTQTKYIDRYN